MAMILIKTRYCPSCNAIRLKPLLIANQETFEEHIVPLNEGKQFSDYDIVQRIIEWDKKAEAGDVFVPDLKPAFIIVKASKTYQDLFDNDLDPFNNINI